MNCPNFSCKTRGLLSQPDTSVTRDCINICKQSSSCKAFSVDYKSSRCTSYDRDSTLKGRRQLQPATAINYYEKICLRGVRKEEFDGICNAERGWTFERILDSSLKGFDDKIETGVESKSECARLCLLNQKFLCRSAEYEGASQRCVLSREDRRTQKDAFQVGGTQGIDYIENQCAKPLTDCSYSSANNGFAVISMDDVLFSRTVSDCQRFCDDARAFQCRSFSQKNDRCYLSGDDSGTLPGIPKPVDPGSVHVRGGIFTYEKTTGHFLRTAKEEPLFPDTSTPGITEKCSELCTGLDSDCPSFSLDYSGQRCFKLDRNTQIRGDSLAPRDGTNYFEKICLKGFDVRNRCQNKVWAFERVPGKMLDVDPDQIYENISLRRGCEELCLREREFICRNECSERSTRNTSKYSNYLENNCIEPNQITCPYMKIENAYPRYLDEVVRNIKDEVACEVQCSFNEKIICRSFAFYSSASQCFISGDDIISASEGALQTRPGTDYFQRKIEEIQTTRFDMDFDRNRRPTSATGAMNKRKERYCSFGRLTYEKTTGYELIRGNPTRLYSERDGGIIEQCASRCDEDADCKGFNMDYNRNECQSLTANSLNNLFNLRTSSGVSYFETTCSGCGLLWTYERFVNKELKVDPKKIQRDVSKNECEDLCLSESSFVCKSANYDHVRRDCFLLNVDRFEIDQSLQSKQGVDYLENQCEAIKRRGCDYGPQTKDRYLIYTDKVVKVFSDASCREACSSERSFYCRSYTFLSESRPGRPQCLLSGDNGASSGGDNAFQLSNGALFSELDCSKRWRCLWFNSSNSKSNPNPENCRSVGLSTSFEKVMDFTYDRGPEEEFSTSVDIGIIVQCLRECQSRGRLCLAATLRNERGGRQSCYGLGNSATVDGTEPVAATGVTYFEKICVNRNCRKSWAFTKIPQYEFIGSPNKEVQDVENL
ncbi:unnamed protein product [Lepeophtheirus salmonis]|uniref:(salmon louse) hypothetical protein n=1 Tax=Lepeophtheirus salmonis TaxID=72036 RepID=A0A7R8H7J6_LEPSM|nr:unnamed protein product [Lepeophtheirus salmonis]CAF2919763.1 unnamed protein product [Lepeophtheirus salmonis]